MSHRLWGWVAGFLADEGDSMSGEPVEELVELAKRVLLFHVRQAKKVPAGDVVEWVRVPAGWDRPWYSFTVMATEGMLEGMLETSSRYWRVDLVPERFVFGAEVVDLFIGRCAALGRSYIGLVGAK